MYLWGFDVTEWAALISVISGIVAGLFWMFKKIITDPARESNQLMSKEIKSLGRSIDTLNQTFSNRYDAQQQHLEEHDVEIAKHGTRLDYLEKNLKETD